MQITRKLPHKRNLLHNQFSQHQSCLEWTFFFNQIYKKKRKTKCFESNFNLKLNSYKDFLFLFFSWRIHLEKIGKMQEKYRSRTIYVCVPLGSESDNNNSNNKNPTSWDLDTTLRYCLLNIFFQFSLLYRWNFI